MENKNSVNIILIVLIVILSIVLGVFGGYMIFNNINNPDDEAEVNDGELNNNQYSKYRLSGNSVEDFDLYFLQLENERKNKLYSPLSIKYTLAMLEEGASGETKKQISNIIGTYNSKKYTNSENMSFANALFIKDSYKNSIKNSYVNTLSTKYNAEVVYDSFATPNVLNSWVSDKTFKLINNLADDISAKDFILVNALAIDMEWVNKIQKQYEIYSVSYLHERASLHITPLGEGGYHSLEFADVSYNVQSAEIGAIANKYDIVNVIGEDSIRETVGNEYKKWLAEGACGNVEEEPDVETYLDSYIEEIDSNYNHVSSSTDFYFHVDDDVKVFAKNLKEYNGTTLQYIGIMPKNENLDNYITNTNASNINKLINSLKPIELNSFKDGVITRITGYIPMFKFDYELNLNSDLNKLGIINVFNSNKADLSNLTKDSAFIDEAVHKSNIEFSNDGIKAAAVTAITGSGAGGCEFDYVYDVPVEKIDLTFDKPYLFLIRDVNSGEVWFAGTVYEPVEYHYYYE